MELSDYFKEKFNDIITRDEIEKLGLTFERDLHADVEIYSNSKFYLAIRTSSESSYNIHLAGIQKNYSYEEIKNYINERGL